MSKFEVALVAAAIVFTAVALANSKQPSIYPEPASVGLVCLEPGIAVAMRGRVPGHQAIF
jgi:hypothetical protein